ncbi:GNAT family N-acetyltransferase [Iodidimonas sp. SYSU 1G8]|uniref:GNAT family N-acetyltransferase n=1 Tax=Iodidimonas sp. SYSU 1G8 TaxID=3133967 RepID=UPI0031FF10A1
MNIEHVVSGKGALCRSILESLPEWFAIPRAVTQYCEDAEQLPMLRCRADGELIAFTSLKHHTAYATEISVMGVRREFHRQGIGRAMLAEAEDYVRGLGGTYLTVKTLAASNPDPSYQSTRQFYEGIGFMPVEIFPTLWGDTNPCLLVIRPVR